MFPSASFSLGYDFVIFRLNACFLKQGENKNNKKKELKLGEWEYQKGRVTTGFAVKGLDYVASELIPWQKASTPVIDTK